MAQYRSTLIISSMPISKTTGIAVAVVVAAALILGGYWLYRQGAPEVCRVCQRPIHAEARAVIESGGKREAVCCVRCGLFLQRQQHIQVRLVEITDYKSGRPLRPEDAYYVEGSRVVMCGRHEPVLDETKHAFNRVFDRCVPSILAFASQQDAEAFAGTHGGAVLRLPQIVEEVRAAP
jgi:hypothetical protein